jgi:small subunit ribosomal protein S8
MNNYSIGDFLIQIKNAAMAKTKEITVSENKIIKASADALKKAGFLDGYTKEKDGKLKVALTFKDKKPLLMNIKLVSKPGLRIYMSIKELEKIKKPSTLLISTPKGMVTSKEAVKNRLGGEVIAEIW